MNMSLTTLSVHGTLEAIQPLAVSPPGAAFPSDGKESPKRLPAAGRSSRYIPASTMRHVLRYGIALVVQTALQQQGRPMALNEILALDKGFIEQKKSKKGKGKAKPASEAAAENTCAPSAEEEGKPERKKHAHEILEEEARLRASNPLLGMLGIWGIPSELRVLNVTPRAMPGGTHYAVASGLVRKGLEDAFLGTLSEADRAAYLAKLDEWSAKEKETTGLKHIDTASWEEIVQGTACDWGYMIHRADPIKSGAVLAALRVFACDPVIGAHRAVGRGEVALDLQGRLIQQDILRGPTAQEAGSIKVARGVFEVTGLLADHLRQFDEMAAAGFPGMDFSFIPEVAASSD